MATDNSPTSSTGTTNTPGITGRAVHTIKAVATATARLAGDLLIVTCWVLFLTLFFLEAAWPSWAFYVLLLVGVGLYVTFTAPWTGSTE